MTMMRQAYLILAAGLALSACAPADDPGGLSIDPGSEVVLPSDAPQINFAGYRAGGNEPFWNIVLTDSTMDFEHVGTEIVASVVKPEPTATATGWQFSTLANGQPFVMAVAAEGCNDSMSGRPFPHTVKVTVHGETYEGCGGDTATLLTGDEWRITQIQGTDTASEGPTMTFGTDGFISGNATCNNYRASYEITGEGITIGPAMATKMACVEEARTQQEVRFLSALEQVTRFDVVEGRLQLYAQDTIVLVGDR